MEDAIAQIDKGFAGDSAKAEIYIDILLEAADELRAMREDIINHAQLLVPPSSNGAHSRRAVAS
jgi:hypothetical protein